MRRLLKETGRGALLAGCACAAALTLGSCAPRADTSQVQADQFALRGVVASSQQQIDSLQEKLSRLSDRVTELEHNSSNGNPQNNKVAALEQRVAKLEAQSAAPQATPTAVASPSASPSPAASGQPGASGGDNDNSGEASNPGGEETAMVPPPPESSPAPEAAAESASSWRAMMDQELASTSSDPGSKLYHTGLTNLKAGKYAVALGQLQTLQRRYPKSQLSEPAEFFAANALYEMGKYDQSILQFNDQTMRFPTGHFASAALLREAQAFMKINDRIDARLTLQKLIGDHPDSPEAPTARSMMQTLTS